MPDLLDKIAAQRKDTEGDLLARTARNRLSDLSLYDPNQERKMYEDIADAAIDLNIDVRDVNANYAFLFAKPGTQITRNRIGGYAVTEKKPDDAEFSKLRMTVGPYEPTTWQKFKNFFTGERAPLSPDADRMEKVALAFNIAVSLPLRSFIKLGKGLTLNTPDLMWAALKRMTPDDLWTDELRHMNLDEAMDWAAGYNPSGFAKVTGQIGEFAGRLHSVAPLAQKLKIIGSLPKDVSTLMKASEVAKLFGTAAVAEQVTKWGSAKIDPTETEYGYEGPIAVLRDMAIGAAFSMVHSGVKGIWSKLGPTEQSRLLKTLGLKKGATEQDINAAARKLLLKYHPDKAKGFEKEFQRIKETWDKLRVGEEKDIVVRGQKVKLRGKLLAGEVEAKPVAKPVEKPAAKKPTKTAQAIEKMVPKEPKPKEPWEMTWDEWLDYKAEFYHGKNWREVAAARSYRDQLAKRPSKGKYKGIAKGEELRQDDIQQALSEGKPVPRHVLEEYKAEPWAQAEIAIRTTAEKAEVIVPDKEIEKVVGADADSLLTPPFREGYANVPDFRVVADAGKRVWDTIVTFGEVARTDKPLYDKLMKTYGKRSAAMETAINKLEKIMPKELKIDDDVLLATTYETKGQEPPENLKELYDNFAKILEENQAQQLEEGIFAKPFQERMIDENLAKIESLKDKLQHPEKSKKIQALIAENEMLKNMRYLPHTTVARNVVETKINRLTGAKRKTLLDRLSYIYRQRKGKMTLKDYLDLGIIAKEDLRMSRLAAQQLADYYRRSAMKALHDYAKSSGLIKPVSDELRAEGWLNQREIGLTAPELKEQLVHPLYAQALREMIDMRGGRGGLRREIFGMVKIGQFIKPTIIYTYNAVQKLFRGMYSLNPATEARALREAFSIVLNKTELYDKLNQDNLYQFPYEVSRAAQAEQLQMWLNQHDPDIDKALRYAEKITDTAWLNPDIPKGRFVRNMFTAAHRAIGRLTWTGDKVQRTQSYLLLRQMGYPHDDAVKVASQSHGGYSLLSKRYKQWASKYFFVYSFRLLMPVEMGKILLEPIIDGAYQYAKTGVKPPRHKMERWAKAVIGSIMLPVMVDSYMRWRGFEPDKARLGPVAWKYKKTVIVDGQEHEIVVGLNYILNMPVKYWHRLSSYDPIRPETRWMQSLKNVVKWEIHPLYRIFFWDITQNRRSFGTGQNVYNTEASPPVQFAQVVGYTFGQSFRFIGGFMDAMGEGQMTDLERKRQKTILNEGLGAFDKILFRTLGYNYIRLPLDERKGIALARLRKEIVTRGIKYHRKYEDEKLEHKMRELEDWANRMQEWVETEMK